MSYIYPIAGGVGAAAGMGAAYYRRWRRSRRPRRAKTTRGKLYRMQRKLNKISPELKLHDAAFASIGVNTTGAIYIVPTINQGDESLERIGLKISVSSLQFKYVINSTGGGDQQLARVIIFTDSMTSGDANVPTVGASDTDTDLLESLNIYALPNHETKARYRILYDKTHRLSDTEGKEIAYANYYKKFKSGKKMFFTGTADAQSSMGRGCIYVAVLGNISSAASDPELNGTFRMRFYG